MSQQPTDSDVIQRVLQGDSRAYAILVDRYRHMVYTLAKRMLIRQDLAEDVAQEVFVKAYQALEGYKGTAKFSTWLYRVAYHRILDVLDQEKRKTRSEIVLPEIPADRQGENATWDGILASERGTLLREVLDLLEAEDRAVLSLHYLQELSLKEVAGVMGLRPDTVKVRLHRARKRLKAHLDGHQNGKMLQNYGT